MESKTDVFQYRIIIQIKVQGLHQINPYGARIDSGLWKYKLQAHIIDIYVPSPPTASPNDKTI